MAEPSPPSWLLHPLPANAADDPTRRDEVVRMLADLPAGLAKADKVLQAVRHASAYEPVANAAVAALWPKVGELLDAAEPDVRLKLAGFAVDHFTPPAAARVLRRLAKDPDPGVRRAVRRAVERKKVREVALPASKDGPWDPTGWLAGVADVDLGRHRTGSDAQAEHGVPPLATVGDVRQLLGVRSPAQLGFFLLATDADGGPYGTFTIPKRDGSARTICAPKPQLKWVQRRILSEILAKVPAHAAAHGFVPGRSTVTNAAEHVGAAVVVKFDLTDFFPTVHYYRVLGLFASLGYAVGNAKFGTADNSKQVAPVLARLCCYAADPKAWGNAVVPQGAPTSPAVSNLVCRRLDGRLSGLAKKIGGKYTRYADDLTFSLPTPDAVDLGRLRWWVDQVCQQEGFRVNRPKFRVIRAAQRQVVTGIVVNKELRIPRDQRRRFRAVLHQCRLDGVAAHAAGDPKFPAYLRGFASYVHMVHPAEGADLLRQVDELLAPALRHPESGMSAGDALSALDRLLSDPPSAGRGAAAWKVLTAVAGSPDFAPVLDFALEHGLAVGFDGWTPGSDPNPTWVNPADGSEMVWVPPGRYVVGTDDRAVDGGGFSLARFPVTNAQFAKFLAEAGYRPAADRADPAAERDPGAGYTNGLFLEHWDDRYFGSPPAGRADHPVVFVSSADAEAYCRWAGLSLPTEFDREAAARGADGRRFPWGDDWPVRRVAHIQAGDTCPVGEFATVRSPFGCEGLVGNVADWCRPHPPTADGTAVVRGTPFLRASADPAAHRRRLWAGRRNRWVGFRPAAYLPCRPGA